MESLFSFLIFAVFFYVMMRFGCGAHMVHGNHSRHRADDADQTKLIDPVCGKYIAPNEGYGKMTGDQLYRFCSRRCLDVFEDDPHRFLTKGNGAKV